MSEKYYLCIAVRKNLDDGLSYRNLYSMPFLDEQDCLNAQKKFWLRAGDRDVAAKGMAGDRIACFEVLEEKTEKITKVVCGFQGAVEFFQEIFNEDFKNEKLQGINGLAIKGTIFDNFSTMTKSILSWELEVYTD